MNEPNAPQVKSVDDRSEYLKFVALLVVTLVAILVLAMVSPVLIGQRAPAVLGLDKLPAAQPGPTMLELPAIEKAPAAEPEVLSQPETAPEAAPDAEGLQHEVQPGQTLFQIAELYGVSVRELAAANHLVNPLQLQAGTILIIPQP